MAMAAGRIVRGTRSASGRSRGPRRGTIALQLPFFRKAIADFDRFFDRVPRVGTLNIAFRGKGIEVRHPEIKLTAIRWEPGQPPENFYLSPCRLDYAGSSYRGLLYIPDPATKPRGMATGHIVEVLTQRVPMIRYGARVRLHFATEAIALVPAGRRARSGRAQ